jgi:hypothetical protein
MVAAKGIACDGYTIGTHRTADHGASRLAMNMERFDYLDRRRQAALKQADIADSSQERDRLEGLARAYSKIIDVLRRESS